MYIFVKFMFNLCLYFSYFLQYVYVAISGKALNEKITSQLFKKVKHPYKMCFSLDCDIYSKSKNQFNVLYVIHDLQNFNTY